MARGKAAKKEYVREVKYVIGTDMHNRPIYVTHYLDVD